MEKKLNQHSEIESFKQKSNLEQGKSYIKKQSLGRNKKNLLQLSNLF